MSRPHFISYIIYDHLTDFPNGFSVFRFNLDQSQELVGVGETLEQARQFVPTGLYNLGRHPEEKSKIIEIWI